MNAQERAALVALVERLHELETTCIAEAESAWPDAQQRAWHERAECCYRAIAALSALPSGGAEGPTIEDVAGCVDFGPLVAGRVAEGPTREQVEALARETAKTLTDHHPSYRREPQVYEIIIAALRRVQRGRTP